MGYIVPGLIGLVSGITSGLLGVGGGLVMVPAMMLLMRMPIHSAIGTSLAVIVPTALIGTYKHQGQGNVQWSAALTLIPLAMVGGYFGAWLTTKLAVVYLKRLFGGFLVLVGFRLLLVK
jgi:uncharacterized protein